MVPAREVGKTAVIWSRDFKSETVVRDAVVNLRLDNGHDELYAADELVEVLETQPEPIVEVEEIVGE